VVPIWLWYGVATLTVVVKLPELSVVKVPTRGCRQKLSAHWNIWPVVLFGAKPVPTTVTVCPLTRLSLGVTLTNTPGVFWG
jgi:hypothetical protein